MEAIMGSLSQAYNTRIANKVNTSIYKHLLQFSNIVASCVFDNLTIELISNLCKLDHVAIQIKHCACYFWMMLCYIHTCMCQTQL